MSFAQSAVDGPFLAPCLANSPWLHKKGWRTLGCAAQEARFAGSLRALSDWASVISSRLNLGEEGVMQTGYRVLAAAIGWFVIGLQYYLTVGKADGNFVLGGDPPAVLLHDSHQYSRSPRHDAALARPAFETGGILLTSLGAHGNRLLHHCRLGDLLCDLAQALESGRAAISRRYARALCRTRPLCRGLAHLRAEGNGVGKIGALLAALSSWATRSFR